MTAPALAVFIQGQGVVSADNLNTFEQTCDNFNELRTIVGVQGMQIFARGTSTPTDGGQAAFYWNATSTAADNDSTVIVPYGQTGGMGAWLVIPISPSVLPPVTIPPTIVTTTPYQAQSASGDLLIDVASTATVNLPPASTRGGPLRVIDISQNAFANNITIAANGADRINGASSVVINSNGGGYQLNPYLNGTTWDWYLGP